MARHLRIAAAQLGPLNLSDTRSSATARFVNLLREAHGMGAKCVVFPGLTFTTFFPRYWCDDLAEVDRRNMITGMLICNDRRWPEAFRVLAPQGAEVAALEFDTPSENLSFSESPALRVHQHLITIALLSPS